MFCKFTNNTNIKHENLGYKHSHPYKICDFQKNCHLHVSKKNPKLSKQTECDKDYGTDVLKGPGPLSPETLPSHFEGLIFFNSETTTQSA